MRHVNTHKYHRHLRSGIDDVVTSASRPIHTRKSIAAKFSLPIPTPLSALVFHLHPF